MNSAAAALASALALAACSAGPFHDQSPDAALVVASDGSAALPPAITAADFPQVLDEAFIRAPQTWLGDDAFAVKWTNMLTSPIALLGGANSAYHADLATRATPLPGGEVICAGDAKLDNFGWIDADGSGLFNDIDFDDAGACPAAADILHFLLATELQFSDAGLDDAALSAYIDTLAGSAAVALDPTTQPVWADVLSTGLAKDTSKSHISLGGNVQATSKSDLAAVTALAGSDARFPTDLLDVADDVQTTGGSGGLRRFWLLVEDATHPRTIIELKELVEPGTELGPHSTTYDGPNRFDVLKPYWWGLPVLDDHFGVMLLGTRFLARDRYKHAAPDPTQLTGDQLPNMIQYEASLMASKHAAAWAGVDPTALRPWLAASAATLAARWRATYTAAGGM